MNHDQATMHSNIQQAVQVDRDDPFLGSRLASHAALGVPLHHNFARTRRLPATIADRFTLVRKRT